MSLNHKFTDVPFKLFFSLLAFEPFSSLILTFLVMNQLNKSDKYPYLNISDIT